MSYEDHSQLYSLQLVTGPTEEPVDIIEAKTHLKVPSDVAEDDDLIHSLIKTARTTSENITNRAFISQTWKMFFEGFPPWEIKIKRPPLQSITHVKYVDTAGALQTLNSNQYLVDETSLPGRLVPVYGAYWPSVRCQPKAVEIQFVCGYGAAKDVPFPIRQAMLLLLGHLYEHRESVNIGNIVTEIEQTYSWLLYPHRILNV